MQGIIGVIQDITEQYENERKLQMLYKVKDAFLSINTSILGFTSEKDFFRDIQTKLLEVFDDIDCASVHRVDDKGEMSLLVGGAYSQEQEEPDVTCQKEIQSRLTIPLEVNGRLRFIISYESCMKDTFTEVDRLIADYIREELPIIYRVYELHHKTVNMSRYDGLTDLFNRKPFERLMDSHIDYADVTKERIIVALVDLDDLKGINDRYGHLAGDAYILAVRDVLQTFGGKKVTIGRLDGDEFAMMFSNVEMEQVMAFLEESQKKFAGQDIVYEGDVFRGSFCYGVAEYGVDGDKKSRLMRVADQRLYDNKLAKGL